MVGLAGPGPGPARSSSPWEGRDETGGRAGWLEGITGETFCGNGFLRTGEAEFGVVTAGAKEGGVAAAAEGDEIDRGGLGQLGGLVVGRLAADEAPGGGGGETSIEGRKTATGQQGGPGNMVIDRRASY